MEREFVSLNIAVLAVSEAESIEADPSSQLIVERLGGAGHTLVQQGRVDDSVQLIRAKLLEHVADAGVDVVVVIAAMKTESAGIALDPLITRSLTGFSDLLRMIAYQDIGSAAMLVDAEAAQCKSTFVFLLPASPPTIKLALEKLVVPQLDYRTKPRNLVMQVPRVKHVDAGTEETVPAASAAPAPWIVPRAPGDPPVPTMFPPRTTSTFPVARKSMQMASVSEVVEKTAASVSQRMPVANPFETREPTNQGPPPAPPPLPRGKVSSTISTPLPNKPPAKLIPLATLLPAPVEAPAAPAPVPEPPPPPAPVEETPRKMVSLAELETDDEEDVAEIIDEPRGMIVRSASPSSPPHNETSGMIMIAPPAPRPLDDEPRRYAEPPLRRRRDGRKLALVLLGVLLAGATSVLAAVMVMRHNDREAQAAGDPPPGEQLASRDLPPPTPPPAPPPEQPHFVDPPPADPPPAPPEQPKEIDMSVPDPNAQAAGSAEPKAPVAPKQPKAPKQPRDPGLAPVRDPADVLATAPVNKPDDGCDEVSCILDHYKQACCARFKPAEPEPVVEKPASGLPEKLDKLMVQEGMAAVKPAVIACGEQSGIHGTVKIQVKVSPSGKVLGASVASSPDAELGACVAGAVKLAKFPETDEGGSFGYPFAF